MIEILTRSKGARLTLFLVHRMEENDEHSEKNTHNLENIKVFEIVLNEPVGNHDKCLTKKVVMYREKLNEVLHPRLMETNNLSEMWSDKMDLKNVNR